ncbi:AAEL012867-PA [Aedes aegypti]|uniref:AAEL012867-PA n=1 Tax=Aedes aegypti TaxID=7159 RepID=Q16KV3_AEDAE|nr:AAEL012867-PA [Aedes aegypti]
MTLVCYKEGSDEIIGTNLLLVKSINDAKKTITVRSQSTRDIIEIHEYMMTDRFNVFERLRVDRYLTAVGLAINRRYRGLGIATEMLRARIPMCQEFQIPVTVTDFTALGSQRAAEKAGFQVEGEVTYDELAKMVWKRPAEVPYPKVWHRFQAKGSQEDGQLEWYTVQDLPEDRFEDAIRHMSEHFARDSN